MNSEKQVVHDPTARLLSSDDLIEKRAVASTCRLRKLAKAFSRKRRASPPPEILKYDLPPPHWFEDEKKRGTVLYLAYGSNLATETFNGNRGIKPLAAVNVQVPELRLTFDLPGIPYAEPCFANSALSSTGPSPDSPYHKDRWHKGMVGVVYEVTPSDYAHIIATEGGGSGYQDVIKDCHAIPTTADTVPSTPETPAFKAHTLFAPAETKPGEGGRLHRPDPSYAQPSARYLKLITDGAAEHDLPADYREYLAGIRPYIITGQKQQMGQFIFTMTWAPFLIMIFALQRRYQDKNGKSPGWLIRLSKSIFSNVWASYDNYFHRLFGDGERNSEHHRHGHDDARYSKVEGPLLPQWNR